MSTRDFVVMQEEENLSTPDDVHEVMLSVSQPGHDDHDQYEERRTSFGRNHNPNKPKNPIAAMWARKYCRWSCYLISLVFFIAFILLLTLSKPSSLSTDPELLSKSITSEALKKHLMAWQKIADTANGTRFITSHGFNDSINYIRTTLTTKDSATAEVLQISTQDFIADVYKELSPSILASSDHTINYTLKTDFQPLAYQHSGTPTALVRSVLNWGCKQEDYANLDPPYIALIHRGECFFANKVTLAYQHGAVGVLIYNSGIDGQNGLFSGTLGPTTTAPIPVFAITYDLGIKFKGMDQLQLYMKADTSISKHTVTNLIAETKGGDANAVIVIGAHLDSVEAGPGLNDDASGSAAVLELATQLSILIDGDNLAPLNKVRFIWFGAEEEGLLGSGAYVKDLNASRFAGQSLNDIALNINLDMLGSPNFVYQIYNGSSGNLTSSLAARSTMIQQALENYMINKKLPYQLIPFDGRSDYQPFIDADIPASGVCSGVDKMKTMEQRSTWGGLANVQYDPCYHQPCDTIDNISLPSLTTLTSTVAYALQHFALHSGLKQMMTHDTRILSTSHAYASHRNEIR